MKINTIIMVSAASLTLLFTGCGNSTNTTANNTDNSNRTAVVNSNKTTANTVSTANNTAAPTKDDARFKGEYLVGDVRCTVTPDNNDLIHEVKCADKEKVQIYSRDDAPPKAIIVSENQKSRFVFDDPANLANGNFTDESGKTVKVSRVR